MVDRVASPQGIDPSTLEWLVGGHDLAVLKDCDTSAATHVPT
jgi:hypothetical protein